jgi:hypothetical protein
VVDSSQNHHQGKGKPFMKEEFERIFREVVIDTGFVGIKSKDTFLYIFGVRVTMLFIKQ